MITQRVLAAIDKSSDPHLHIDILRAEIYRQSQAMEDMARDIKLLQDAERERLTRTGVWTLVKQKLEEETIDWVKWGIRGTIGTVGVLLITGLFRLVWKYT
jgi:hypothetical protein